MVALSWLELVNVVGSEALFQRTTELVVKLEPLTVIATLGMPATAVLGEIALKIGRGISDFNGEHATVQRHSKAANRLVLVEKYLFKAVSSNSRLRSAGADIFAMRAR